MNAIFSGSVRVVAAGAAALAMVAGLVLSGAATAEERHERREVREPYRTPHMVFDDRYHHGHYYPTLGYTVSVLPPGYVSLRFGPRRFFFQGGVWFETRGPGFVVVRPPIGVVIPVLPPAYATVWVGGVPYYYANDVYYTQGPGGYMVAAPPPGETYTEMSPPAQQYAQPPVQSGPPPAQYAPPPSEYTPPAQAAPPASAAAPPPSGDKWFYCESAKGYYPYVPECKEGWRAVPATPPTQPR